jgi:hypothetical protein
MHLFDLCEKALALLNIICRKRTLGKGSPQIYSTLGISDSLAYCAEGLQRIQDSFPAPPTNNTMSPGDAKQSGNLHS